jgi:hypothetical protein
MIQLLLLQRMWLILLKSSNLSLKVLQVRREKQNLKLLGKKAAGNHKEMSQPLEIRTLILGGFFEGLAL